jgi:hypothetical protein
MNGTLAVVDLGEGVVFVIDKVSNSHGYHVVEIYNSRRKAKALLRDHYLECSDICKII